ncbi:MAG: thiamine-phosphate synthase family protein [Candidatus Hodarchaeales archaeon]|jgi:predicted fused transcriptional regulator/phosphomethylpyrimidine kinase/predicted transcriptional regulator
MNFVCEIVPSSFLTPLRRLIAQKLSNEGWKQVDIGSLLGVSQPVISSYLSSSSSNPTSITSNPTFKGLVDKIITKITEDNITNIILMEEICNVCQTFRTAGPLCEFHRRTAEIDFLPNCSICFPSETSRKIFDDKLSVTRELYEAAVRLIGSGERFAQLIPEVGCQFVSTTEESEDFSDIAGFPGRIIKVKDKGQIISYPEFGQGAILAQILGYFKKQSSEFNSLISIRRTEDILKAISPKKEVLLTFEADKDWIQTLQAYSSQQIQEIEIIADAGGLGLEPLIYLFGNTPNDIVDFLLAKF